MYLMKKILALAATVLFVATFGVGCSGNITKSTGRAKVSISGSALVQSDIASMTLTVGPGTGTPSFNNIVQPMSKNTAGDWTGYVTDIPAGTGRTFHVDAFDSASAKIYQGDATATITAGGTAMVFMMLQQLAPPNQFSNHAPVIDSLTASSGLVIPGTVVDLNITAHDPDTASDPNNKIAGYKWTATCGTLVNDISTNPTWTAPATDGTCTINVSVSDVCGPDQPQICSSTVTASLQIIVQTSSSGNANVAAYPNTCPAITCVFANEQFTYDASGKVNGYEADLTINAADADGDDLHYVWSSAGCPSAIFTPTGANPTGEIVSTPTTIHFKANTTSACDIRVDVADFWTNMTPPAGSNLPAKRGCDNTGFLSLAGTQDFQFPPVIVRLSQPNAGNQVSPGQPYTFGADVSDPQNAYPLTISWTNDGGTGTIGTLNPASGQLAAAGGVSAVWTAPATLAPGMKITLKVTNSLGLSVSHIFPIVPANACALSPDGTSCDDGNACTGGTGAAVQDVCMGGVCVSGTAVQCQASDSCHLAGVCDPSNGQCSNPGAPANTSCNADNNACTQNDSCDPSGVCVAGPAEVCNAPGVCQSAAGATCDPANGTCNYAVTPDVACSTDLCNPAACSASGACVPGTPVTCPAGQSCDPIDGACKSPNLCTGVTCTASDLCHVAGSCDPASGICSAETAKVCPTGQTCDVADGQCKSASVVTGPQPALSKNLGISRFDGLAMDNSGASYVAGSLGASKAFDSITVTPQGSTDLLVAKYDPATHAAVWAVNFGGGATAEASTPTDQFGAGSAVTADGTVAVIGNTSGGLAGTGVSLANAGTQDFLIGLNGSTGAGIWGKAFTNGLGGALVSISANPGLNLIAICGYTDQGATDLVPGAVYGGGTRDAIIGVFNSTGALQWSKQLGSGSDEECDAVAIDDAGDVYAAGKYNSATGQTRIDPGLGQLPDTTSANRRHMWVAKYRGADGTALAQANFGSGNGNHTPKSLAVDTAGNLVVAGQFNNTLPLGSTSLVSGGSFDGFMAKMAVNSGAFAPIWAVRLGGTGIDLVNSVATTSLGEVVAVGSFNGTTSGAAVLTAADAAASDAFVLKLDANTGATQFAAAYGDASTQSADRVVANRKGTGATMDLVEFGGGYAGAMTFPPLTSPLPTSTGESYLVFAPLAPLPAGTTHW